MAQLIPRSPGPQVEVNRLPEARVTARLDTSHIQQGVQRLGDMATGYFEQQVRLADDAALMEARSQLSGWARQVEDPGNPNGLAKYRGKFSLQAGEKLLPQADTEIARIRQGLAPRQQARFDAIAGEFREGFHGSLNRWSSGQFKAYEDETFKATTENLANDAVTAAMAGDYTRQTEIANELLAMNGSHLINRGADAETVKAANRAITSGIHASTVDGMMTGDPLEAQAYYARFADQMQPADRLKVERALYPTLEDVAADAYADAIYGGVSVQADAPESIDDAIVQLESGGVDTAKAATSSATGAGQFVKETWLQVVKRHRPDVAQGKSDAELLALRTDGALSREMVSAYRRDNSAHLQANGVQTTAANVYAAHHFGPGGGVRFGKASDGTPMSSILTDGQMAANPYLRGMTKGEAIANWQRRGLPGGGDSVGVPIGQPGSESEALARAREIRDPRLRSAVVRKVQERYRLDDMRRREQDIAMSEHSFAAIEGAGDANRPLREIIGADAYAWAVREGKAASLENLRINKVQDGFVQDDPVMVEALSREAALSPDTFTKRNLYDVVDRLSTQTLSRFLEMQREANKPEKRAEWATHAQRIERGYVMLGIDSGRGGKKKTEKEERARQRGEFEIAYNNAEREFVQRNGRKPNPTEADDLVVSTARVFSHRMASGRITGRVDADGNPVSGMYSRAEEFNLQVTPAERAEVRRLWIQKYGLPPTESELIGVLARMKARHKQ